MKSLWKLPEPGMPRTRPPLPGKLSNSFPQLPQAPFLFMVRKQNERDISISLRAGTFSFALTHDFIAVDYGHRREHDR